MRDDAQELLKKLDLLDQLSESEAAALNVQQSAPSRQTRDPSSAARQAGDGQPARQPARQSAAKSPQASASVHTAPNAPPPKQAARTNAETSSSATATLSQAIVEAAETCHHATQAAQTATDHALQAAQLEQENIEEIKEALQGWRRVAQNAQKELKRSRTRMGLMLTLTLLLALAGLGGSGWLYYQMQRQSKTVQNDLLDMLQTQTHLLGQKLDARLDELASLAAGQPADSSTIASIATPVHLVGHDKPGAAAYHAPARPPRSGAKSSHATASGAHAAPNARATDLEPVLERLEQLKRALAQLSRKQGQLQQQVGVSRHDADAHALDSLKDLLQKQQRQLETLQASLWKLRQQVKAPSAVKASTVGIDGRKELRALGRTLKNLVDQFALLKRQHAQLENALQHIQRQLRQLNQNRPYSYRAPPMNIE